jgi:sulfur relay (sulfurtransferase) DsrF/TusC family protein
LHKNTEFNWFRYYFIYNRYKLLVMEDKLTQNLLEKDNFAAASEKLDNDPEL